MKKRLFGFILVIAAATACQIAPPPVEDAFLVEQTPVQADSIKKLEASIVEKKKAQDKAESSERIAAQWILVAKQDAAVSQAILGLMQEKEKLYNIASIPEKQEKVRKDIVDLTKRRAQAAAHTAYREAAQRSADSELNIRKAELAVVVAKLQLLKALIAGDYQTKRQTASVSRIDAVRYSNFATKTESDLKEAQDRHKLALEETRKAKEQLDASGFQLEELAESQEKEKR